MHPTICYLKPFLRSVTSVEFHKNICGFVKAFCLLSFASTQYAGKSDTPHWEYLWFQKPWWYNQDASVIEFLGKRIFFLNHASVYLLSEDMVELFFLQNYELERKFSLTCYIYFKCTFGEKVQKSKIRKNIYDGILLIITNLFMLVSRFLKIKILHLYQSLIL